MVTPREKTEVGIPTLLEMDDKINYTHVSEDALGRLEKASPKILGVEPITVPNRQTLRTSCKTSGLKTELMGTEKAAQEMWTREKPKQT